MSESWSQYLPVELKVVLLKKKKEEDDEIPVLSISIPDSDGLF